MVQKSERHLNGLRSCVSHKESRYQLFAAFGKVKGSLIKPMLATLAVIGAILPMAFVGGLMGPYAPHSHGGFGGDVFFSAGGLYCHPLGLGADDQGRKWPGTQ